MDDFLKIAAMLSFIITLLAFVFLGVF